MTKIKGVGYYIVHRSMFNHWLWKERILSEWEAWQWMIAIANYENKKWTAGNQVITVERGQFITSIGNLQKTWKWTNHHLRSFLKTLANDQMIHLESTTHFTRITICKYDTYQDISQTNHSQTADNPLTTHLKTTHKPQQHKEEKKERIKEEKNITPSVPLSHELQIFVSQLNVVSKLKTQLTPENCEALIKKYGKEPVEEVLLEMENYKALQKYTSVYLTCIKWLKIRNDNPQNNVSKQDPAAEAKRLLEKNN